MIRSTRLQTSAPKLLAIVNSKFLRKRNRALDPAQCPFLSTPLSLAPWMAILKPLCLFLMTVSLPMLELAVSGQQISYRKLRLRDSMICIGRRFAC